MNPEISIIVPVYNDEKYLDELCNDIMNQSFTIFEVIFVDDGSTDNSLAELKKHSSDKRVRIISQKNKGQADARSTGIKASRGKYVTFCDADDRLEINWLESMIYGMKPGVDISVVGYDVFRDNLSDSKSGPVFIDHVDYGENIVQEWLEDYQFQGFLWNKMFNKKMFENVNLVPGFNWLEDVYILNQIVVKAEAVSFSSQIVYHYRQRSNSSMQTKFDNQREIAYWTLKEQFNEIGEEYKNLNKQVVWRNVLNSLMAISSISFHNQNLYKDVIADFRKYIQSEKNWIYIKSKRGHRMLKCFLSIMRIFGFTLPLLKLRRILLYRIKE
ncbi:glycosyltransferase family 2 protein [Lacticaseibacillus hulanensis]|uniref:glycosyltransferase family 2 protein n=1 Tax=Lacticaseibacillus hulanensis TaxID=2493111 RepID=UPI001F4E4672|nr:glycosyltransferase family 2 protein [Lacticaseibacillus hulanensis]